MTPNKRIYHLLKAYDLTLERLKGDIEKVRAHGFEPVTLVLPGGTILGLTLKFADVPGVTIEFKENSFRNGKPVLVCHEGGKSNGKEML